MYGVPQTANSVRLPSPMDTLPYQRRGSEIDSALGIFHRPLVNDRRFHRATGHEFLSLPATHAAKPPSHRTSVHLFVRAEHYGCTRAASIVISSHLSHL